MYRSLLLLSNSNCFIVANKHDLILSYLILGSHLTALLHEFPQAIFSVLMGFKWLYYNDSKS